MPWINNNQKINVSGRPSWWDRYADPIQIPLNLDAEHIVYVSTLRLPSENWLEESVIIHEELVE